MLVVVVLATLVYALVNAFGAWAVSRRKPWLAALFMLAASLLTVAAVALGYTFPLALTLLALGLVLASVTSLLNARIVLGRVVWRHHLIRAGVAVVIFVAASLALPG